MFASGCERHLCSGKNVLEINPAGSHQSDGPDDSIMGLLAGGPKASRADKEKINRATYRKTRNEYIMK
jgi:hypothetical protein